MNIFEQNKDTEFHFMVDIETLATSNNAAITEIGAVVIADGVDGFRAECWDGYGERDPKTVQWRLDNGLHWSQAEDPISWTLNAFFRWIEEKAADRTPILWCKGTDFDAVILANAAKRNGFATLPWKYNNIRDVRTLLQFFPQFKVPKEQVTHNGLEDAILQKDYLLKIANEIAKLNFITGDDNG